MSNQLFRTKLFKKLVFSSGIWVEQITPLTDANTLHIFAGVGLDTNDGARSNPVGTITYAKTLSLQNLIIRGQCTENIELLAAGKNLIGDGDDAEVVGTVSYGGAGNGYIQCIHNIKINILVGIASGNSQIINCRIKSLTGDTGIYDVKALIRNCLIEDFKACGCPSTTLINDISIGVVNNTIINYKNYAGAYGNSGLNNIVSNSIITNCVDLFRFSNTTTDVTKFYYCLFRKLTQWLWNGSVIPITYGNDEATWIQDIRDSLTAYADTLDSTNKTYLLNSINTLFALKPDNSESCKVVDDINGTPIFNRYNGGTPIDYSLYLNADNQALYMSNTGAFVGAYSGNLGGMTFNDITDVDASGVDTANVPNILTRDSEGNFYASNQYEDQYWNRVVTDVFFYPRGYSFDGMNSYLESGITKRFWFGKLQPFTAGNIPVETVEVIPFDNALAASAFPRFSAKFTGVTKMWYHISGAKSEQPVLFSDLLGVFGVTTNKDLDIYGDWAVTEADSENFELGSQANCGLQAINIKYFKLELNIHYAD